jgi:hypothetical protein
MYLGVAGVVVGDDLVVKLLCGLIRYARGEELVVMYCVDALSMRGCVDFCVAL